MEDRHSDGLNVSWNLVTCKPVYMWCKTVSEYIKLLSIWKVLSPYLDADAVAKELTIPKLLCSVRYLRKLYCATSWKVAGWFPMRSLIFFTDFILLATMGGKGGLCIGMITLPCSWAVWKSSEPQTSGAIRGFLGLYRDSFTFILEYCNKPYAKILVSCSKRWKKRSSP
jgi:hypothetical protein